ncbi:alkaline phosphatase [Microbulbifer sp. CAU 1566]|uniref:alkaline phosphatase n=1 Tax=Microbulbifer sp. CAU 1566 TaxID=2933269 RepID=UPI002003008E|nr:alkaline phosphatase [Microbulbifer sp. CAU 1566]MCK7597907.1 alkaline phosphatase [Microbulbifer sp. CAU 1566]
MQRNRFFIAFTAAFGITLAACSDNNSNSNNQTPEPQPEPEEQSLSLPESQRGSSWYVNGEQAVSNTREVSVNSEAGAAKNVILFVGDGMGISTVTAARILAGQMQGQNGEEYQLSFEKMPFAGLIKTYNTNQQTPDSAGTATAMLAGVKTKAGVINVDESVDRSDCAASLERPLTTAVELAEALGKSTGVISTARITHATPAAAYAKVPERNWEYSAPDGCKDIATQLVALEAGDGIDVIMGGGRRGFLPPEVIDAEGSAGRRSDGVNLVEAWQQRYSDGVTNALYIQEQQAFDGIDVASTDKLLGLFASSHMRYEADRSNDVGGEPSLSQMTGKAIELLGKNDNGYFMLVESGRIDHGHHAGSAYSALTDAIEFANAIQVAMDNTDAEDTLIVVTADHSHVMTIAGYPTRGNPILGKVVTNDGSGLPQPGLALADDGMPYTTITYTNGLGHAHYGSGTDADDRYEDPVSAGRQDIAADDTQAAGYHQEALVPMGGGETHAGEDVGVWARGPGAHLLSGTNEQSYLFHVMAHAGGLLGEE